MNTVEHHFQIPALSCGHCVAAITKALTPLGVQVHADPATKTLQVEAPAELTRERIVQVLTIAGYSPS